MENLTTYTYAQVASAKQYKISIANSYITVQLI